MEEKYIAKIFDVGQAQAVAFYNTESKECCFVDLGSKYNPPVVKFLERNDFDSLCLCITHWHDDHYDNATNSVREHLDIIEKVVNPSEKFTNKEYVSFVYEILCSKYNFRDPEKCEIKCSGKDYEDFIDIILDGPNKKNIKQSINTFARKRQLDAEKLTNSYLEAQEYIKKYSKGEFLVNQFLNCENRDTKVSLLKTFKKECNADNVDYLEFELDSYLNKHPITLHYGLNAKNLENYTIPFEESFKEEKIEMFNWLTIYAIVVSPKEYLKRHKERTEKSVMDDKNNFGIQYIAEIGVEDKNYVYIPGDISRQMSHLTRELMEEGKLSLTNEIRKKGFSCNLSAHHGSLDANDSKIISFFQSDLTAISAYKDVYNLPDDRYIEMLNQANQNYLITSQNDGIEVTFIKGKMHIKTGELEKMLDDIIEKETDKFADRLLEVAYNFHDENLFKLIQKLNKELKNKKDVDYEILIEKLQEHGYNNRSDYDFFFKEGLEIRYLNVLKRNGVEVADLNDFKKYFEKGGTRKDLQKDDFVKDLDEQEHSWEVEYTNGAFIR